MGFFSSIFKKKKKNEADVPFAYSDAKKADEGLKDGSEVKTKQPQTKPKAAETKETKSEDKRVEQAKSKPAQKPVEAKVEESKPKPVQKPVEAKVEESKPKKTKSAQTKPEEAKVEQIEEETAHCETESAPAAEESFGTETVSETTFVEEASAEGKPARTGTFEIKRAKDGRYVFNLYASNRVIIARSQIYSSSSNAQNGIRSVIANAPRAKIEDTTLKKPVPVSFPKWEIYLDKAGQYRFRLYATNGDCICHSRGYTAKSSCKSGIQSIIRFATDAKINKIYLGNK